LIIRILHDFDDAPSSATAFGLPVFYRGLFAADSRKATHPEYSRPEMDIGSGVIEEQSRFD
jgi:hypothetical protein